MTGGATAGSSRAYRLDPHTLPARSSPPSGKPRRQRSSSSAITRSSAARWRTGADADRAACRLSRRRGAHGADRRQRRGARVRRAAACRPVADPAACHRPTIRKRSPPTGRPGAARSTCRCSSSARTARSAHRSTAAHGVIDGAAASRAAATRISPRRRPRFLTRRKAGRPGAHGAGRPAARSSRGTSALASTLRNEAVGDEAGEDDPAVVAVGAEQPQAIVGIVDVERARLPERDATRRASRPSVGEDARRPAKKCAAVKNSVAPA